MPFEHPTLKNDDRPDPDERQRELDIDLIRRGASYEITSVPAGLADELIKEQKGELYPDLASYIKSNKVIACPAENMSPDSAKLLRSNKGAICQIFSKYYYVDHEGNVAAFQIGSPELQVINTLKNKAGINSNVIWEELEKLGFKPVVQDEYNPSNIIYVINKVVNLRREAINREEEQRRKDEFDF